MRNNMNAVQNVSKRRDDRAGRRCTIGNRVYAKSVSGVRIPISPPVIFRKRLFWALSFSPAPLAADTYLGRVAERLNAAVSKTVLPVLPVTRVQIPPLPPEFKGLLLPGLFSYRQPKPHIWEYRDRSDYRQKNVSGYAINHQFKYGNSSF